MSRVNVASIAAKLQALGFSMTAAQQLLAGQVLSELRDRRHLALFLTGLFEGGTIQPGPPGGLSSMRTQSGVVIEFQDGSGSQGSPQSSAAAAAQSTTLTARRTSSGLVVSFEDNA